MLNVEPDKQTSPVVNASGVSRRKLIVHGVAWNTIYQIFQSVVSFAAMLLLVRVIPAVEYGRVSAVLGILVLINSLNCVVFINQALQLPEGHEPDWSLHWSVGFYIQVSLSVVCHVIAGIFWLVPAYSSIAPLLHIAAIGLVLDWPSRLSGVMLQRNMAFRRLRTLSSLATLLNVMVTVPLALGGVGAYAIILGSNVVPTLPCAIDLLIVRRWRPRPNWWRWPDWSAYRLALRFGSQQIGSGMLYGARGAIESIILSGTLGFASLGLLNRAQALFSSTVGRAGNVVIETVYPLLPRYAADRLRYPRHASLFAQFIFFLVFPAALFLGLEGPVLSRVVYGEKWIAADPLIWPGTIIGIGVTVFAVSGGILLAVNRLRVCFTLHLTETMLTLPTVAVAWAGGGVIAYAWALATAQLIAGAIALATASPFLLPGWIRKILLPPIFCSLFAAAMILVTNNLFVELPLAAHLFIDGATYGLMFVLALRCLFPVSLIEILSRLPGGLRLQGWLRLAIASEQFS